MVFSSFDLIDSNEQSTHSITPLGDEAFDPDASAFFDFIDSTNFNTSTTGTDQPQQRQRIVDSSVVATPSDITNNSSAPLTSDPYSILSPLGTGEFAFHTPSQQPMNTDFPEDEEFLTPLVSPAIPPNYFGNLRSDTNFSPLTSPALGPQISGSVGHLLEGNQINNYSTHPVREEQSSEELQERLEMIEQQQQQLRFQMQQSSSSTMSSTSSSASSSLPSSPVHKSTPYGDIPFVPSSTTTSSVNKPKQQTLRHQIAMSSPNFNPVTHLRSPRIHPLHNNQNHATQKQSTINHSAGSSHNKTCTIAPATPSLLMKLGNGTQYNDNSNTTPKINSPIASPYDSVIDNMMVLPDAMLPPSDSSSPEKPTKPTPPSKRRRISYPRSAFTPPALLPSYSSFQQYPPQQHPSANGMAPFDQGIAALISPAALRPHTPLPTALFSPRMMMSPKGGGNGSSGSRSITSSPRSLKPLISPSLQADGKRHVSSMDEQEAAAILTSKSNYQALREGRAKTLGIDFTTNIQSGMESRRSAHKAAEQRRRDTLKQSFDALRMELLEAIVAEDALQRLDENDDDGAKSSEGEQKLDFTTTTLEREKKVKQMSKVILLQHSYEYLLRLKSDNQRKDAKLEQMTLEIQQLRSQLGMEPITEQERQAEAEEKQLRKKKRLVRLKRLEDMVDT
ncbi:hypothetical protein BCR42DRAFT_419103 [Absidia repens]|uniref:BHLH domain-containing protein n=1 Tax=Absidia repens TaxID=90262 RepID=A0A1X2IAY9_9FUNG|nr:hypothetical protein BCR42DRAFT_419103 [Absidia repens]